MSLILVAGSDGEGPAHASNRIARSAAVRAMKPGVSSDGASGTLPPRGTRPKVGLMPATPQSAAGIRMDPPVSLATAAGTRLAATAAAEPPLEPPVMNAGLTGLRVPAPEGWIVVMPQPNSCDLVSPTITAPARLSRLMISESYAATAPR